MNHQKLYVELGKLLYAIINADGNVRQKEISALKEIVLNEFVPVEEQTDEFAVNDAFYTEYEFETLVENDADVEIAFASFIDFLKENAEDVTDTLKTSILNAAKKVAQAFHGSNRIEEHYIQLLTNALKAI